MVRQARFPTGEASKGKSRGFWLLIPESCLETHEEDLAASGATTLGKLIDTSGLNDEERLRLANALSCTRDEQKAAALGQELPESFYELREAELMARCPVLNVTGFEIDTKGPACLDQLLMVKRRIEQRLLKDGIVLRWSYSSTCNHLKSECDGRCVTGLHGEPGFATPEARHPELARMFGFAVSALAEELEIPAQFFKRPDGREWSIPDDYAGPFLDLSTLNSAGGTRGKIMRPLGGQHPERGPKQLMPGTTTKPSPITPKWIAPGRRILERLLAEEEIRKRALTRVRSAQQARGPIEALPAGTRVDLSTRVLEANRPAGSGARHQLTLCLPPVFASWGVSQEDATAILQGGLRRSEVRTVARLVQRGYELLKSGRPIKGKGALIQGNHYSTLVQLAGARSRETGQSLWSLYCSGARAWHLAGADLEQRRAEELWRSLPRTHRYWSLIWNMFQCGLIQHKVCSQHGPVGQKIRTCKALHHPYCKSYQFGLIAERAAELWRHLKEWAVVHSREYPTYAECKRAMKGIAPGGARWFVGSRGPGRWYRILVLQGEHANATARQLAMIPGGHVVDVETDLTPAQVADRALACLLNVHAVARDLFMSDFQAWEAFMDQIHGRHLTGARRGGRIVWPSKHQRLDAGEDWGEGEHDCTFECQASGCVEWTTHDQVSQKVIHSTRGFAPQNHTILCRMEAQGLLLPSQRLAAAQHAIQEERQAVGSRPPPAPS